MNRALRLLAASSLAFAVTACSMDRLPFVYVPDVNQGMLLTQEMVDQLKAGMTRRQVQYILGSPPLVDTFHQDRWEYIEGKKPGKGKFTAKRITVFFEGDRLVAVSGDLEPADPALRRDA